MKSKNLKIKINKINKLFKNNKNKINFKLKNVLKIYKSKFRVKI